MIALAIVSRNASTAVAQYRVDVWTTEQGLPQHRPRGSLLKENLFDLRQWLAAWASEPLKGERT